MNYLSFYNHFGQQGIVSTTEIRKAFPLFDARRLVEWQRKGYLQRLANRWYQFTNVQIDEELLWWTANRLYQPSYLSLESALSYHGLIPEGVFTQTSVTTRKTQSLRTRLGTFSYHTLKSTLYFGYTIVRKRERPILIADLEKTLLDVCYLNPQLQTEADFAGMRLNATLLAQRLDLAQFADYQRLFTNQRLNLRVKTLRHYIDTHA
jgi:predicted transcriptional regulator of viral defense system